MTGPAAGAALQGSTDEVRFWPRSSRGALCNQLASERPTLNFGYVCGACKRLAFVSAWLVAPAFRKDQHHFPTTALFFFAAPQRRRAAQGGVGRERQQGAGSGGLQRDALAALISGIIAGEQRSAATAIAARSAAATATAGPPLAPHRIPPAERASYPQPPPCAFLRPGQTFEGRQRVSHSHHGSTVKQEHWEVQATIQVGTGRCHSPCRMQAACLPGRWHLAVGGTRAARRAGVSLLPVAGDICAAISGGLVHQLGRSCSLLCMLTFLVPACPPARPRFRAAALRSQQRLRRRNNGGSQRARRAGAGVHLLRGRDHRQCEPHLLHRRLGCLRG